LALLVHSTDECIVCQPDANYRPLRLGDIKQKHFHESMLLENQDIKEEMYVFLYEVVDEDNTKQHAGVPALPMYSVDSRVDDIYPIQGKIATFPTRTSLLKLATTLGIDKDEVDKLQNLPVPKLIKMVMKNITSIQNNMIDKTLFTTTVTDDAGNTFQTEPPPTKIADSFRKLRQNIQSKSNVRLALVGGLHRTALAIHILGNYVIHSSRPRVSEKALYALTKSSSMNADIAIHIILPITDQNLDVTFIQQPQHYSRTVNDRKHKALEVPISGQLYDLLKFRTNENLTNMRYLPKKLIDDTMVCKMFKKTSSSFFTETNPRMHCVI